MAGFAQTSYLQKKVGDHCLNKAMLAPPAELFLSLHTASPTDSGSFAAELSGGQYARQPILTKMTAVDLSTGISQNTAVIQTDAFSGDLGIVTSVGLSDSLTGGTMWFFGDLDTAFIASMGSQFQLVPGELQLQWD